MTKSNYLLKNVTLLNILLIAAIILMANYTVLPLLYMDFKYTLPSQKKTADEKEAPLFEHVSPSPSDYMIIAEENLFHPERKIPPEKKDEQPLPKPEFVLYGTMITDNVSLAYLEDQKAPRSTPGRGKRQVSLRKGDTLSGFTLKEIETDKIVMVRGDEKMTVYVYDSHKPKTREAVVPVTQVTPAQPARIPSRPAGAFKPPTSPQSLVQPSSQTRTRAPIAPADQKVRDFFHR